MKILIAASILTFCSHFTISFFLSSKIFSTLVFPTPLLFLHTVCPLVWLLCTYLCIQSLIFCLISFSLHLSSCNWYCSSWTLPEQCFQQWEVLFHLHNMAGQRQLLNLCKVLGDCPAIFYQHSLLSLTTFLMSQSTDFTDCSASLTHWYWTLSSKTI